MVPGENEDGTGGRPHLAVRISRRSSEKQAANTFTAGDCTLGKADEYGQRINIAIDLPGVGSATGEVGQIRSGWMIRTDGTSHAQHAAGVRIVVIKPYDRVRLVTDRFEAEGVPRDSVGYAVEKYADGALEVEFSDPATGRNWATIVALARDLALARERPGGLGETSE